MSEVRKNYPDNSAIHARKVRGRKQRASVSFAEKLKALDELKERVAPIVLSREMRKQAKLAAPVSDR